MIAAGSAVSGEVASRAFMAPIGVTFGLWSAVIVAGGVSQATIAETG